MDIVRGSLRGRPPATGDGPSSGAQPEAADADHSRRAAVRRRAVGGACAVRARPVRRANAGARGRGVPAAEPARRGARGQRRRDGRRLIELAASEYTVGLSLVDEVRAVLAEMKPDQLATHLIGGLTVAESGLDVGKYRSQSLPAAALDDESMFVLPPLPNTLFTRDSSCWIYGGVSINPMFWPARRLEAYNVAAIYRYHPMFRTQTSSSGTRRWVTTTSSRSSDFGRCLARGRRRAADRQRHRPDRHERALPGPDDRADRRRRCSPRERPSG